MVDIDVDIASAAYDRLVSDPVFQQMVEDGLIGTDAAPTATPAERLAAAWVFQGLDDEGRPFRNPEGSGTGVVVLTARSEWSAPNRHNTAAFPVLQILVYMDSTRNADGAAVSPDATAKVKHVAKRINRRFHLVANRESGQKWGTLWVHSSLRSGLLDVRDVPMSHSLTVRAEMKYETVTD